MTDNDSRMPVDPAAGAWLGSKPGVAAAIRQRDWRSSPLGPIEDWPESLRTMLLLMLDFARPACLAWGPEFIVLYNDGYAKLLGARHPEALGTPAAALWQPRWDQYKPCIDRALAGESAVSTSLPAIDAAGPDDRAGCSWMPARGADGAVEGVFCLAEPGNASQNQRHLAAEVQHRVRNTLAVIRSIARRTADNSGSVEDYRMHFDGRLAAFARTQGYLTRNPGLGIELATIVADELLTHQLGDRHRAAFEGPEVRLAPRMADQIGLAIHELTTNAVKYGALGIRGGRLSVSWWLEDDNRTLHLIWREFVADRIIAPPDHEGFGTELLQRSLPYELGAEVMLEYNPDGLSCVMTIPLG